MFGKLFGKKDTQPTPSQSMSGVNANGGQVLQNQAGRDGTAAQQGQMQTQQQGISGAEVVKLLGDLKGRSIFLLTSYLREQAVSEIAEVGSESDRSGDRGMRSG